MKKHFRGRKNIVFIALLLGSNLLCAMSSMGVPPRDSLSFHAIATFYHDRFNHRLTSSGEVFSQEEYTAAHKTLPLQTLVKVTSMVTGRSVLVKVNDRCPKKNILDLSKKAARQLKIERKGFERVCVEVLSAEYMDVWKRQGEIFDLFDRRTIFDKENFISLNEEVSVVDSGTHIYSVRLASALTEEEVYFIVDCLPEKYHHKTYAMREGDTGFFKIVIRPFDLKEEAEACILDIHERYPASHIEGFKVSKKE